MIATVGLHASPHIGRFRDLAVLVDFKFWVNAAHILTANQADTGNSGSHGKMLPIGARNLGAAQRTREHGYLHFDLFCGAIPGFGGDLGKNRMVRICLDALGTNGISIDIEVGIVHWVVFVGTGGHLSKGRRVEQFTPPEGRLKQVTVAFASVNAPGTDT